MKTKISLLTTILMVGILIFSSSCGKTDNVAPVPPVPTVSQWTFDGVTYNPTATPGFVTEFNTFLLDSRGNGQDDIYVFFGSATPSAGEYTVINGGPLIGGGLTSNQCYIEVKTTGSILFYSLASATSTVKVTISGGKVIATLSNVTVVDIQGNIIISTKTISGTLVQTPAAVVS